MTNLSHGVVAIDDSGTPGAQSRSTALPLSRKTWAAVVTHPGRVSSVSQAMSIFLDGVRSDFAANELHFTEIYGEAGERAQIFVATLGASSYTFACATPRQTLADWGLHALDPLSRKDLLEVIDDRADRRATIITAQLPIEHWHGWIGEPTVADAIRDRLRHHAHRLTLKGESLRMAKIAPQMVGRVTGASALAAAAS
jgi:hypothetical protein